MVITLAHAAVDWNTLHRIRTGIKFTLYITAELSIGLGLFGTGSDLEKLSGFNRTGRQSTIEIFMIDKVFAIAGITQRENLVTSVWLQKTHFLFYENVFKI